MSVAELETQLDSRGPLGASWRRRAAQALADDAGPEASAALARALAAGDGSGPVAAIARDALVSLADQDAIDALCEVWAATRSPALGEIIATAGWVASSPPELLVLTRLKTGWAGEAWPPLVKLMLAATVDTDPVIADRARERLSSLRRLDSIDALCALVLYDDDPVATEIAVAQGYRPCGPGPRALFLFLTGQWQAYDELDFDHAHLRAAYAVADPALRKRLADRARQAGRRDWVEVVAGSGRQSRDLAAMSDDEWGTAISVLEGAHRHDELWRLALEAPPLFSARILRALGDARWAPPAEEDRTGYERLVSLAGASGDEPGGLAGAIEGRTIHESAMTEGRAPWVTTLAITPDGSLLASGGWDETVRLWRLPDGAPHATLEGQSWVNCLAVTPDGSLLASASDHLLDGSKVAVRLWRLPGGAPHATLAGSDGAYCLAIAPAGDLLAAAAINGPLCVWRLPDGARLATLSRRGAFFCLAITPDGAVLASGGSKGTIRLWGLPDGARLATLRGHSNSITSLAVTPDGALLVSGSHDSTVRLWHLPSGEPYATLDATMKPEVAVTPDGALLASGSGRLWHLPEGTPHARLNGAFGPPPAIAPDGTLLATGGWHDDVRLWRLPDGAPVATLSGHSESASCLAFAPDSRLLASGSRDGTVRLWTGRVAAWCRTPVAALPLDEAEAAIATAGSDDERAWLELIVALGHWARRFDVEVGDPVVRAGEFDIELGS